MYRSVSLKEINTHFIKQLKRYNLVKSQMNQDKDYDETEEFVESTRKQDMIQYKFITHPTEYIIFQLKMVSW